MVRPRGAGFVYNELQSEQMIIEAEELLEHGADGIAFGFLDPDGKINSARTRKWSLLFIVMVRLQYFIGPLMYVTIQMQHS